MNKITNMNKLKWVNKVNNVPERGVNPAVGVHHAPGHLLQVGRVRGRRGGRVEGRTLSTMQSMGSPKNWPAVTNMQEANRNKADTLQ